MIVYGAQTISSSGVLSRLDTNNVEANHVSLSLRQKLDDVSLPLSLLQCLACVLRVRGIRTFLRKVPVASVVPRVWSQKYLQNARFSLFMITCTVREFQCPGGSGADRGRREAEICVQPVP
jgi:hypothetical protein